jgi:CHAT domain-containing protein/tetratricopeptide (TPR) repeat protein
MDQSRKQAYTQLIQKLLACSENELSELLEGNQELLDDGFVQAMQREKSQLSEAGEEDAANFLQQLAEAMAAQLGISATSANYQDYRELLQALFEAEDEDNSQRVNELLAKNQSLLNQQFAKIMIEVADELIENNPPEAKNTIISLVEYLSISIHQFSQGKISNNQEIALAGYNWLLLHQIENSERWARTQNNLGAIYSERIIGERAYNLEKAIFCYQSAINSYSDNEVSQSWAIAQYNLGLTYQKRIQGNRKTNSETAIVCYKNALKFYNQDNFPQNWAIVQNNLGLIYKERIEGNRVENLEKAIACYQNALKVRTKNNFPQDWADTQSNLGDAYKERIEGNCAKNLEKAFSCYQNALTIYSEQKYPYKWVQLQNKLGVFYWNQASSQHPENLEKAIICHGNALKICEQHNFSIEWAKNYLNLGNAYLYRWQGNRSENLEKSIDSYNNALIVYKKATFAEDWAMVQNNLGNAYRLRICGDRSENLEKAIFVYNRSLQVRTKKDYPQYWAGTNNNLGNVYQERIEGDRKDNLEKAIEYYKNALTIYTKENFPQEWASVQNNLGSAYQERICGKRSENLEKAIVAYRKSLEVRTKEKYPQDWVVTLNNLGIVYQERIKGDRENNLETAIQVYTNALQVCNEETFPEEWATIQNNLGSVYHRRIQSQRAENLEKAIEIYQKALKVRQKESLPQYWATTQNNLGFIFQERIYGNKDRNINKAIEYYNNSLQIYTSTAFPLECLKTSNNLGSLAFKNKDWQLAIDSYTRAITVVQLTRSWALTDERRQQILEESIGIYHNLVQAYLNTNQLQKAWETVESSKTRNLVESFANRDLQPKGKVPSPLLERLGKLRRRLPSLQRELQLASSQESRYSQLPLEQRQQWQQDIQQQIQQTQQEFEEVLDQIQPYDASFRLTQEVPSMAFEEIQQVINQHTALIEWYITEQRIIAFVVTHQNAQPFVWQSSKNEQKALVDRINDYLNGYYQENQRLQWQQQLPNNFKQLAEILHIDELLAQIPPECDQLILVPHWFLHLFPLHALSGSRQIATGEGETVEPISGYLLDLFPGGVRYAPSCQLLQLAQQQQRPQPQRLFAVENPTEDLNYTDLEIKAITSFFPEFQPEILNRQNATETSVKTHPALSNANCTHFSCHGTFNPLVSLESGLLLSSETEGEEDGILTLAEIFALNLTNCRLVSLSACETGMVDPYNTSDEYIGLPSGFLFAGSPSVVASLWSVRQCSTAFLMAEFYRRYKQENLPVAVALNQAQMWLRDATTQQLQDWIEQFSLSPTQQDLVEEYLEECPPHQKPFQHPYYWAAFCAVGQ